MSKVKKSVIKTEEPTIEERYKKKSLHRHILDLPDTYIGSVQKDNTSLYVWDDEEKRIIKKTVEIVPGLYKICDEIFVNAVDNTVRDPSCNIIKFMFNKETGVISVENNGSTIPIEKHKEENMYVPEMIFGTLLTSGNYDQTNKIVGGKNGLGSKCVSIYSETFEVEITDGKRGLKYYQKFYENMFKKDEPVITKNKKSQDSWTKITFKPDYKRFGFEGLTDDMYSLLVRRAFDIAGTSNHNVRVYLNDELVPIKTFEDYIQLYIKKEEDHIDEEKQNKNSTQKLFYTDIVPNRWSIGVIYDTSSEFQHMSFVNNISTYMGGTHVDYITNQIVEKIKTMILDKYKNLKIKNAQIKDNLTIFINCIVEDPAFSSQTKESLTTKASTFQVKCELDDKFITKIAKSGLMDEIVQVAQIKQLAELEKTDAKKNQSLKHLTKLDDARWAGTRKASQCRLIVTEGDSAKTFALSGLDIIGRDKYGTFPLKGKCLSKDTRVPIWNGEIKLAKDIQIGDILIGDDGNKRTVLTLYKGTGKMYEVFQDRGDSYKVNDEHILTLCVPEHKVIYWQPSSYTWKALYWDKETKNIKVKLIPAFIKVKCKECDIMLNAKSLKRHYTRKHTDVEFEPYKLEDKDMNDKSVIEARKKMEEFLLTIDDNNIIDINIQDYFKITESLKRKLKGIRGECVNWEHQKVVLDPYVLGLWLGDGCKKGYRYACDGENDYQIIDYLKEWGLKNDGNLKKINKFCYNFSSIKNFGQIGEAPLKKLLSTYDLINNKHIPKEYLINSKEIRLKVLAGIIDTDGYVASDGTIEISQSTKHKQLVDDIVYLSRSLGFYTYLSDKKTNYTYKTGEQAEAYRIKISGDTEEIPTLLPRKKSTSTNQYNMRNSTGIIKIKEIENGNYVGIGIDGNNRFLINDFTVTHNCLNVRDATPKQLLANEEIKNLKQILGLKQNMKYTDTKKLRYGGIILLCDSDVDGYHIKGLLMNFLHYFWPSLLKIGDFIQTLATPIIKAFKNSDTKRKNPQIFYTLGEFKEWEKTHDTKSYEIKYYKGLGTSTKDEAKESFIDFDKKVISYLWDLNKPVTMAIQEDDKNNKNDNKSESSSNQDDNISISDGSELVEKNDLSYQAITLAFAKNRANDRKDWLRTYDPEVMNENSKKQIPIYDFINKDFIHFSNYDNIRSIPNIVDGFKPSQRKIMYGVFKRKLDKEVKVAQLSGYISEHSGYHHGEVSLQGAIVNMAQDFCGSNNINLLKPNGNFGTRRVGGKDAASSRYIFTQIGDLTKDIYIESDNHVLEYNIEDGDTVEPKVYYPIIPMILVNGIQGIGTGYSTSIPSYNPLDLVELLTDYLNKKDISKREIQPYYKGFKGEIRKTDENTYIAVGVYKIENENTVRITELPIGTWTDDYLEYLHSLTEENGIVTNFINNSGVEQIDITVYFTNNSLQQLIKNNSIEKKLKLTTSIKISNMHVYKNNVITKYKSATCILMDYAMMRLEKYKERKAYLLKVLKNELLILQYRKMFIEEILAKSIIIERRAKSDIIETLVNHKYPELSFQIDGKLSYNYLTDLPLFSLTKEKIEEYEKEYNEKKLEYESYENTTIEQMWLNELQHFVKKYNKWLQHSNEEKHVVTKTKLKPKKLQ